MSREATMRRMSRESKMMHRWRARRRMAAATKELLRAQGNLTAAGRWLAYCAQRYAQEAAAARAEGIRIPKASWWVEVKP